MNAGHTSNVMGKYTSPEFRLNRGLWITQRIQILCFIGTQLVVAAGFDDPVQIHLAFASRNIYRCCSRMAPAALRSSSVLSPGVSV